MGKKDQNIEELKGWLQRSCSLILPNTPNEIQSKIDILDRTIQYLRIKCRYLDNKHRKYEEFIQGQVCIENDSLQYLPPERVINQGSGTKPILLQPKLLIFLLLNHSKNLKVYDIIEGFINEIWDYISDLDFKRTQTGVVRCFTNTRFAANTLRDYGLLKFTKKEAFKTWTLSLYGFLVASKVMQENLTWNISKINNHYKYDLHPEINISKNQIATYEDYVKMLSAICEPKRALNLFETFESILKEAYKLLDVYWSMTRQPEITKQERQKESFEIIKKLESHPLIESFYNELSSCIYVDAYLKKLVQ